MPFFAQENLKILRQFTKLLQQACHERDQPVAHAQPLANTPASCAGSLQWFAHLAQPCRGLDDAASARIGQLLQLHAAVCKPDPAATPQEQAYELARSLPHYDRDLTAFYLLPDHLPRMEYELDVAHSILRLHAPATLDGLRQRLPAWRSQGLLHVLAVAATHMPEPADWIPDKDAAADSLGYCLEALRRSPREYAHTIESFIATQDLAGSPTAQAVAATLDRLAILMDVKSDAEDEAGHDLGAALAAFPKLDALPPGDAWWSIRPALERALPPSVLRLNPAWASKRAKTAFRGTWYASRPFPPQPRVGQHARQDRVLASASKRAKTAWASTAQYGLAPLPAILCSPLSSRNRLRARYSSWRSLKLSPSVSAPSLNTALSSSARSCAWLLSRSSSCMSSTVSVSTRGSFSGLGIPAISSSCLTVSAWWTISFLYASTRACLYMMYS